MVSLSKLTISSNHKKVRELVRDRVRDKSNTASSYPWVYSVPSLFISLLLSPLNNNRGHLVNFERSKTEDHRESHANLGVQV
jgi:hypothetical protein